MVPFGGDGFDQLEMADFQLHAIHYYCAWQLCPQSI
jgi:hypothetical protein